MIILLSNIGEDFIKAEKADKIGDLLKTGKIVRGWIHPNPGSKIRAKGGWVVRIMDAICIVFNKDASKGRSQKVIFDENTPISGIRIKQ